MRALVSRALMVGGGAVVVAMGLSGMYGDGGGAVWAAWVAGAGAMAAGYLAS